ncbi:MAG: hypothetical protein ACRD68_18375, partial [Pyrinomonadaceae bacterium]
LAGRLWGERPSRVPEGTAQKGAAPVRLAMLPVSVGEDGDGELQLLAVSVTDLLVQRLTEVPNLVVRGPVYETGAGASAPEDIPRFAARAGSSHVISGTLRRGEDGVARGRLTLTLHEVRPTNEVRDTPLGSYDIPFLTKSADVSHFAAVRDNVSRRILDALLPAIDLAPNASIAPRDPEAYRLYLLALGRLRQVECEGKATLELLDRSIELDPDFAPAWEARGLAHYNLVSSCARDKSHYRQALDAAGRALELAPNWARAVALKAAILTETGHVEEAYTLLRESNERFPHKPELQYQMSYALCYAGYLAESRRWVERVVASEPVYFTAEGWTPNALLYQGEWDCFLELLSG